MGHTLKEQNNSIYDECGASNSEIGPFYPQQYSYNELMETAKKVGDLEANIHDALDRWSFNEPQCSHFMWKERDADEVARQDRIHEQRAILKIGRKPIFLKQAKVGKRGAVEEYIGKREVMGVEEDEKEKESRKPNAKVGARSRTTNRDASTSRKDGKTSATKRKNKLVDDTRPFKRPKLL
ncbi:hypothetical protein H0H93_005920 [Arthromyces matolae]|nr:hypothetical protein H0H93_005920 [Arthromyces matolae]